ncbi:cyclophane-containing peptide 2OG-Fe(II) oxygenase YhhC [Bradyrhizobium sp. AZCC 2289]|uniref:cyclophane-containing peptide 2OG-Fe(II) oxygenase YhhC n=1 Tax=Bradyrhizobium sp. AZCC 2289 TaxID=3117026 RepID=UPI002FF3B077
MMPVFDSATRSSVPFPHLQVVDILPRGEADRILRWFKEGAPWKLTIADFYEQYEFSLLHIPLSPEIERLTEPSFTNVISAALEGLFELSQKLKLVGISAHKLTQGQTIRIHNDFLGAEETHRLLIQFNDGWEVRQGGLLMLFASDAPESLQSIVLPAHASGFAFEISPKSFHAVSSISAGERYTLVYTFRGIE